MYKLEFAWKHYTSSYGHAWSLSRQTQVRWKFTSIRKDRDPLLIFFEVFYLLEVRRETKAMRFKWFVSVTSCYVPEPGEQKQDSLRLKQPAHQARTTYSKIGSLRTLETPPTLRTVQDGISGLRTIFQLYSSTAWIDGTSVFLHFSCDVKCFSYTIDFARFRVWHVSFARHPG